MKLHLSLPLLFAVLTSFGMASASITSTISKDKSTQTFTGKPSGFISASDYNMSSNISTDAQVKNVVFSSVELGSASLSSTYHGAYFTDGEISKNITFEGSGLTLIKGIDAAATIFTGSVSGSGAFTLSNKEQSSTSQDFVFTGDMTSYSGAINLQTAKFTDGQSALNGTSEGILQFGQNTVAQGTVSGEDGNRTIMNVVGSGSITTTGVLRFLYTDNADTYDYLTVSNAITARYVTVGGGTNNASYVFTGKLTGQNGTASNNTLVVNADTDFQGAVTNFGTITVNKVATFNSMLSGTKVTVNDGATLKLNAEGDWSNTLSGSGTFDKTSAGTVTMKSSNSGFTGTTKVSNGTLAVGASNALGSGAVIVAGGTLDVMNQVLGNSTLTVKGGTLSNFDISQASGTLQNNGLVIDLDSTTKSATLNNVKGQLVSGAEGTSLLKEGESLTISGSSALVLNDVKFTLDANGDLCGNTASLFNVTGGNLTLTGTVTFDITTWGILKDGTTCTIDFATLAEGLNIDVTGLTDIKIVQNGQELSFNWGNSGFEDAGFEAAKNQLATAGKVTFTIPEPSTATLSLLALAGLLARRRRCA